MIRSLTVAADGLLAFSSLGAATRGYLGGGATIPQRRYVPGEIIRERKKKTVDDLFEQIKEPFNEFEDELALLLMFS